MSRGAFWNKSDTTDYGPYVPRRINADNNTPTRIHDLIRGKNSVYNTNTCLQDLIRERVQ